MTIKTPSHHGVKVPPKPGRYPDGTIKLLIERASCRVYADKKVPASVLKYIFEAGIHSPTGGNLQPYSIIKIENSKTKARLAELCGQSFLAKAPVHLIFCLDFHRLKRWAKLEKAPFTADYAFRHFWIAFQDTIICAQNICTAADSLALGSVYIGTIIEYVPLLRKMCRLPKGVVPVVLLALGYPAVKPAPRKKLGMETIVHKEIYTDMPDKKLLAVFGDKYKNIKVEMTDERLKEIFKVCKTAHGERFARLCIKNIKERKYINPAQRYFGLHYKADKMPSGNEKFLKTMENAGLKCFKKFNGG